MKTIQLITLSAILIAGFALVYNIYFYDGKTKPIKNAEILGTESKSNNIFHQVLVQPESFNLEHDGIVICFEKIDRSKQIVREGQSVEYTEADRYKLFGIDQSLKVFDEKSLTNSAKQLVKYTLNDPKPIMLTHWFESTGSGKKKIHYNAYQALKNQDYDLPSAAILEYKKIGSLIKSKLESGEYTHLLIGSTGWQNDQQHSLETYNNWLKFIAQSAQQESSSNNFKPLFLGITWPSKWNFPVISVFNKANDADELGMTHINYLIWNEITPIVARLETKIPIITIGHSFGARLISRANHSRFMLTSDPTNSTEIDLEIDLQGAYPVSRFLTKEGNNGGLYTVDNRVKRHAITTSRFDRAVKYSLWSTYVGNNSSTEKIAADKSSPTFGFAKTDNDGRLLNFPLNHKKVTINADAIINQSMNAFTRAHGDVSDQQAGCFIWELIKRIE